MSTNSITTAAAPPQAAPKSTATGNGTPWTTAVAAQNAPIMYSDPWARLITFMIPKTSVNPDASKNSMTPNCNELNNCSRNSCTRSLHLALGGERVAVVFDDARLGDDGGLAVGAGLNVHQIPILNRILIRAEFETAANRFEIGFAHLGAYDVELGIVAVRRSQSASDEVRRIVG